MEYRNHYSCSADGTNHFANAGKPGDSARLNEYTSGPTATLADEIIQGLHELLFLTQTSRRLLIQSSKLWTTRSENARSEFTSIQQMTGPRSLTASLTACVLSFSAIWDLPIYLGRLRDRRRECISPQPIGNSSLNRDT